MKKAFLFALVVSFIFVSVSSREVCAKAFSVNRGGHWHHYRHHYGNPNYFEHYGAPGRRVIIWEYDWRNGIWRGREVWVPDDDYYYYDYREHGPCRRW